MGVVLIVGANPPSSPKVGVVLIFVYKEKAFWGFLMWGYYPDLSTYNSEVVLTLGCKQIFKELHKLGGIIILHPLVVHLLGFF